MFVCTGRPSRRLLSSEIHAGTGHELQINDAFEVSHFFLTGFGILDLLPLLKDKFIDIFVAERYMSAGFGDQHADDRPD